VTLSPIDEWLLNIGISLVCRVQLYIVDFTCVDRLVVLLGAAYRPIATLSFPLAENPDMERSSRLKFHNGLITTSFDGGRGFKSPRRAFEVRLPMSHRHALSTPSATELIPSMTEMGPGADCPV
jgi:hypothetical protein